MNVWKIPKFQWNLSVRYQNIPPHTWTYQSSRVLVKFILMFHQNIAAIVRLYEKFQNSSEIYPYDIKIFHLIHWTYQSSRVLVKFLLTFHQNIAANVWMYEKFQNSSEIYPYIIKIFQLIVLFQWQKWNFISQSAIFDTY